MKLHESFEAITGMIYSSLYRYALEDWNEMHNILLKLFDDINEICSNYYIMLKCHE